MAAEAGVLEGPLGAALREAAQRRADHTPPPAPPHGSADDQHPWLGLDSFSEETRAYFYGREQEVAELSRRVQRKLLTILFGQSGLGKTSILRAGIVPKLRPNGYCPVYVRIDYARESPTPSEQIKAAIFRATQEQGEWTRSGAAVDGESLWEFLHHRDDVLKDASGQTVVPLLIFDQFEEIFTLAQADDEGKRRAAQFLEDLGDLVENRAPKELESRIDGDDGLSERFDFSRADYRILIALREDYLAHLEGVKGTMPSITQNRMRLARMTGQQALAAVIKPGGKLVTEEVAESIVRFIAGGSELPNAEVEPSLLSLICRELNNARIAQGRAEISVDLLAGSKETILVEFYERALADQPAAVRRFIEDEMLTESGYRESLGEERVRKAFTAAGASPDALARLVDRRLLRVEERLDLRRVELTHDVLCKVVAESRDLRHAREEKEAAERQLAAQKTREAAARQQLVRARKVAAFCVVLAVGAVASAIFGFYSQSRARAAEAEAVQVRAMAERARAEAEKLVGYLLDDFYLELQPVGRLAIIESLAQRAIGYYRELPPQLRSTDTEANRSLAQVRLGQVLGARGKTNEAEAALTEAMTTLRALHAKGSTELTRFGLARALAATSLLAFSRNQFDEAVRQLREGLELLDPVVRGANPPAPYRRQHAVMQNQLGLSLLRGGQDGAVPILESAFRTYKELGAKEDPEHSLSGTFGFIGAWLSEALYREGRPAEARIIAEEALSVVEKAVIVRPSDRGALRAAGTLRGNLSQSERQDLRWGRALAYIRAAERDDDTAYRSDPKNLGVLNNLAVRQASVSNVLVGLGRFEEALRQDNRLREWDGIELNPFLARNMAFGRGRMAETDANWTSHERAMATLAEARRFVPAPAPDAQADHTRLVAHLDIIEGRAHLLNGDAARARKLAEATVAAIDSLPAAAVGRLGYDLKALFFIPALGLLADAAQQMGDYVAAESAARRAIEISQKRTRYGLLDELERSSFTVDLALAVARRGRTAEARSILQPALAVLRRPEVQGSDYVFARELLARALLASAIATPAQRDRDLAEAARILQSMPEGAQRWKTFVRLRQQIAAEASKR